MKAVRHFRTSTGWIVFILVVGLGSAVYAQQFGGRMTFGTTYEPDSFNPYKSQMNPTTSRLAELVYESLVTPRTIVDPKSEVDVVPMLASQFFPERPEVRTTEFTFILRKGVLWHSRGPGEPHEFTADDVKFTIDYIQQAEGIPDPIRERYSCITNVQVHSDFSLTVHLDQPRYNALYLFTFKILPKHCFDASFRPISQALDIHRFPIGTGPYRFDRWDHFPDMIYFTANDGYWNGHPHPFGSRRAYIDTICVYMIPDEDLLIQSHLLRAVDIVAQVRTSWIPRILASPHLSLQKYLNNRTAFIAYNNADAPFDSRDLRYALSHAIDRRSLVGYVYAGHATLIDGPLPPWFLPGMPIVPHGMDNQASGEIIRGLGFTDRDGDGVVESRAGRDLSFDLLYPENQAGGPISEICQHFSQSLADIDVAVDPVRLDDNIFKARLYGQNNYTCAFRDIALENISALSSLFKSSQSVRTNSLGQNFMNFSDPEVDLLIDRYESALDSERRLEIAQELQTAIAERYPATFLWCVDNFASHNRRLRGVKIDPLVFFRRIEDWYIAEF